MFQFPDLSDLMTSSSAIVTDLGTSWYQFIYWAVGITVVIAVVLFVRRLLNGGIRKVSGTGGRRGRRRR